MTIDLAKARNEERKARARATNALRYANFSGAVETATETLKGEGHAG